MLTVGESYITLECKSIMFEEYHEYDTSIYYQFYELRKRLTVQVYYPT